MLDPRPSPASVARRRRRSAPSREEQRRRAGRARSTARAARTRPRSRPTQNPSARSENTPASASSSTSRGRSRRAPGRIGNRPSSSARDAVAQRDLVVGELEVHLSAAPLGQAEHRSPMMLRWICDVPAAIVSASVRSRSSTSSLPSTCKRVAVEHAQAQLAEPLPRLGVRELDHHRARARRARAPPARRCASSAPTARRARRCTWPSSRAVRRDRARSGARSSHEPQRVDELAHERGAALELERDVGDAPAVVLGADPVRDRDPHVVEEHLAELRRAEHGLAAGAPRCRAGPSAGSATRCRGASARRGRCARGARRRRRRGRTSTRSSGR